MTRIKLHMILSLVMLTLSSFTMTSFRNNLFVLNNINRHLQCDTIEQPDKILSDTIIVLKDTLLEPTVDAFTANASEGWGKYSAFYAKVRDSVQMEVILYRNNNDSIDWFSDSRFGNIDSLFVPSDDQFVYYHEADRTWLLRIGIDQSCTIKLVDGPKPTNTMFILPIQTRYGKGIELEKSRKKV